MYYVGAELFGIVGFIDSSEMVSTFGSSPSEVRGFVKGGWKTCQNRDGNEFNLQMELIQHIPWNVAILYHSKISG